MSEENIRIMCPNLTCRRVLAVPNSARGRVVRCRGCGANIKIPPKQAPAPVAPEETEVQSDKNDAAAAKSGAKQRG